MGEKERKWGYRRCCWMSKMGWASERRRGSSWGKLLRREGWRGPWQPEWSRPIAFCQVACSPDPLSCSSPWACASAKDALGSPAGFIWLSLRLFWFCSGFWLCALRSLSLASNWRRELVVNVKSPSLSPLFFFFFFNYIIYQKKLFFYVIYQSFFFFLIQMKSLIHCQKYIWNFNHKLLKFQIIFYIYDKNSNLNSQTHVYFENLINRNHTL